MSSLFQIVFKGELLDGFDLAAVKASAARRLKAAPEQLDRLFSGTRAVLKKGLTEDIAQRYLTELQRIGMLVSVEPETVKQAKPTPPETTAPIAPADVTSARPPWRTEPQRVTSRDKPAFDPLKTQIASMREDPPSPQRWSQPTIAISQRHLNEMQTNSTASNAAAGSEPTLIVPPRNNNASQEPTIVVSRGTSSASQPGMIVPSRHGASDPTMIVRPPPSASSSEPTMVVPPRHSAASEPTMIVPPCRGAAAEPTMIVPPRHSASSEPTMIVPPKRGSSSDATMIVPPRHSAAAQPTIIVRSNQKLPPAAAGRTPDAAYDPEKTLIGASDNIADYLSPASDEQLANAAPLPARRPVPEAAPVQEVQCPTCGDKQPKRVYCRRCGHALSVPAKQAAPISRTPQSQQAPSSSSEETVIYEETPASGGDGKASKRFPAWRAWLAIGLVFVLLLGVAVWLLM
ncbi:MAG: hypothetical protein JWN23_1972 [Rhodocyclales bacterium]|nr:hypothetical protein [Rhodocyclales bacterium]